MYCPNSRSCIYCTGFPCTNNCVSLKISIPLPVTLCAGNMQELKTVAQSLSITSRNSFEKGSLQTCPVRHICARSGYPTGMRSVGHYMLTEDDMLQCRQFDDGIAVATWPIEEWGQQRREHELFQGIEFYQVPTACLQSGSIDNLFFAGRNISASEKPSPAPGHGHLPANRLCCRHIGRRHVIGPFAKRSHQTGIKEQLPSTLTDERTGPVYDILKEAARRWPDNPPFTTIRQHQFPPTA